MSSYITNMFNNFRGYFKTDHTDSNEKTELIKEELPHGINNARFTIERILSENIKIGIMNKGSTIMNDEFMPVKYTNQGLQYKDQYYSLTQAYYSLTQDKGQKLSYNFRGLCSTDNITLELILKSPDIYYSLHNYNNTFESGYINNMIIKTHKTISLESKEFDWISELFNKN